MKPTETETTLVVVSTVPVEVADSVAALIELDGFDLRHRPDAMIRDRYFDTSDGTLQTARTALRLREVGPECLLTIKGPSRPGRRGGRTRDEQEEAWPDRAWALLLSELGHELRIPISAPVTSDPAEALQSVGLVVFHDRQTSRRVRDVVPRGAGRRVAELAIDAVTFHLGIDVRHYEVEIEAKVSGGDATISALAESLAIRFRPSLRPWEYGKLATGEAAAALIDERGREAVVEEDGTLRPSAYDAIPVMLARERAGHGQSDGG